MTGIDQDGGKDPGADPARDLSVLRTLDLQRDAGLVDVLLNGLAETKVGICLCDAQDRIRYTNSVFRLTYLKCLGEEPTTFVDALAAEIRAGRGINLGAMSLEEFIPRAGQRRKSLLAPHRFTLDIMDGSWWQINEHKLDNGWFLVMATEITGLKSIELQLREDHAAAVKAAQTDFLTSLGNRRYGLERAQSALEDFDATRLPLTIALVDIDHFKRVNDLYGHDIGDKVLVHFSQQLLHNLDTKCQVSRIGGEEFLIVMPETPSARARAQLDPVLRNMEPLPAEDERDPLYFTVSAGLAEAHPSETLTDLLHRADVALYEAKARGRHRIELSPGRVFKPRHVDV